jgi:hypothetical protein
MAEERSTRLVMLRRRLRSLARRNPTAWVVLGTTSLVGVVIVAVLMSGSSAAARITPTVSLPPGMGAVVGGIEACYDSGPPPGGYPWIAGAVGLYTEEPVQQFATPVASGSAVANGDFVVVAPPGNYELAPYAGSNPAVSVTVRSGNITYQDLRSGGCI